MKRLLSIMMPLFQLLRPKQWTKNFLVFAPLLFTASWNSLQSWQVSLIALVALCLTSSCSYILNDLRDIERDRAHPTKRNRPIASGAVSKETATGLGLVCGLVGLGIGALVSFDLVTAVLGFFGIHLFYIFFAKQQPVLDVTIISLGYVLRPVVGAVALQVPVSGWLVFCTGSLALLLATIKRRQEFLALGSDSSTRPTLRLYSIELLNMLVGIGASLSILTYGIYAIESPTAKAHPLIIASLPFVLYGVLRYVYLAFGQQQGEEPESVVFSDVHLVSCLFLFVTTTAYAMSRGGW